MSTLISDWRSKVNIHCKAESFLDKGFKSEYEKNDCSLLIMFDKSEVITVISSEKVYLLYRCGIQCMITIRFLTTETLKSPVLYMKFEKTFNNELMEFLVDCEDYFTERDLLIKSEIFSKSVFNCLHQRLLTTNLDFKVLNANSHLQGSQLHFKLQCYNSETIQKNSTHFRKPLHNHVDPIKKMYKRSLVEYFFPACMGIDWLIELDLIHLSVFTKNI